MTGTYTQPDDDVRINLIAPVLAWIIPGWGHWHMGHRARAIFIALGILVLYVGGLLIGGIDVVDREEDFWWYCGQVCASPATLGIEWVKNEKLNPAPSPQAGSGRQTPASRKPQPPLPPSDPNFDPSYVPAYSVSLGHANEMGTLFTTIAGMLNLIVILEAFRLPRHQPGHYPAPGERAA